MINWKEKEIRENERRKNTRKQKKNRNREKLEKEREVRGEVVITWILIKRYIDFHVYNWGIHKAVSGKMIA